MSEAAYLYGPCLLKQRSPVLAEYLEKEKARVRGILEQLESGDQEKRTEGQRKAAAALAAELKLIKEAQYEMQ